MSECGDIRLKTTQFVKKERNFEFIQNYDYTAKGLPLLIIHADPGGFQHLRNF